MARSAPTSKGRSTFMGIIKGLAYAALLSILALVVSVAVAVAYLPSYGDLTKRNDLGQMIRVRAANGQILVSMGPSFGQWLTYERIPPEMRAAMISTEDRRFRSPIGIDPIGLARAVGGAYGIDAASRKFFGHGADNLSLGEAAIIAGLVKAPSNYSPTADIEAARSRSGVVLQTMVKNGFITADTAAQINPAGVRIQETTNQNSVRYFTDWALPQLDTLIDRTNDPI